MTTAIKISRINPATLATFANDNYTPSGVSLWQIEAREARQAMTEDDWIEAVMASAPITNDDACVLADAAVAGDDDAWPSAAWVDYSYCNDADDCWNHVSSAALRRAAERIKDIAAYIA
jgi:hypothetical protein